MPALLLLAFILTAVAVAPVSEPASVSRSANGEFITNHYPYEALKKGEYGKVSFELAVEPDGALGSCEITGSSGFATLDRETCDFMTKYARLQPVRNSDGRAVQQGYINWQLPAGRRPAAAPASVRKVPTDRFGKPLDMNKTICRTIERTGSRVGGTKTCMTRTEWARSERESREGVLSMQGAGGGCAERVACNRR